MAYSEQTFTNLGGVQAPDPSLSETFAGGNFDAFKISDQTNQVLNQIGKEAIAKRENEVKQFNTNLQSALGKASEIQEGLNPQDYEVAQTKSKDAIKYLYDNMEILSGKSPEKQRKFNEMLVDISTFAQLSKGTKKVEDTYNEFIKKDADWSNPVNTYYLEEYRKGTPQEKAQKAFTPIKNPINDFQTLVVPKLQAKPETTRVEITEDPLDKGSKIVSEISTFNESVYKEAFKNYNGEYLTEEWKVKKAQGDTNIPDTPQEYIEIKAKDTFQPTATKSSKVSKNVQYSEEQKNERNEASIQGRATEGAANRNNRIKLQELRAQQKSTNPEYKNISPILQNIEGFESHVTKTFDPTVNKEVAKLFPNVKSVQEVDATFVNEKIANNLYKGGKSEYGDAYGKLFIITDKSGNKYYSPAKKVYLDGGEEISKTQYAEQSKLGNKKISTRIVPDEKQKYTMEALVGNSVTGTVNGAVEFEKWSGNNKEIIKLETEDKKSTTAPKSASAERQLDNPKVNQLLKASYMDLKKKYPTIDTNGIIGDASHKARDSDHNTMDAIDIVNFGDKSSSVITDLQKDGNVKYIIFNKQIWNPKEGWKTYTGKNPHKDHIHVSYKDDGITEVKKTTTKGKYKFNPTTGKLELQ